MYGWIKYGYLGKIHMNSTIKNLENRLCPKWPDLSSVKSGFCLNSNLVIWGESYKFSNERWVKRKLRLINFLFTYPWILSCLKFSQDTGYNIQGVMPQSYCLVDIESHSLLERDIINIII